MHNIDNLPILFDFIRRIYFDKGSVHEKFLSLQELFPIEGAYITVSFEDCYKGALYTAGYNVGFKQHQIDLYESAQYHHTDPNNILPQQSKRAVSWQGAASSYTLANSSFLSLMKEVNLESGITLSYKDKFHEYYETYLFLNFGDKQVTSFHTDMAESIMPHIHHLCVEDLNDQRIENNKSFLTAREKEVLYWIKEGKSSWEVGTILSAKERTVKFHLKNIYSKLGTTNRTQAVLKAAHMGLF